MWRYSSIMALDFFSTSSSDMEGLGRGGGGVGALSRLTAEKQEENNVKHISLPVLSSHNQISVAACFFTCEIFAWTPVPTSSVFTSSVSAASIPASSVPIICHASNAPHRFIRASAVIASTTTLLWLSAEASLGDLVAFPSLAAVESVKTIPVPVAPFSVTTTFTAGAWSKVETRSTFIVLTYSSYQILNWRLKIINKAWKASPEYLWGTLRSESLEDSSEPDCCRAEKRLRVLVAGRPESEERDKNSS